jgi:hypothetical protein
VDVTAAATPPQPVALVLPAALPPARSALVPPPAAPAVEPEPQASPEPAAALPVPLPPPRPTPDAVDTAAAALPPPRPAELTESAAPDETARNETAPASPAAPPEAAPAPTVTAALEPDPPTAEDPADPDAPTELAVMTSPTPRARPVRRTINTGLPAPNLLPSLGESAPKAVRSAATDRGLALDQTALIGILNLDGNRKALLRLPSGRYRSVVVGDVLDGWQVSDIGTDAMRMTRDGEDRTLQMVNR